MSQNSTNTSSRDVHVTIPELSILRPQEAFLIDSSHLMTLSTLSRDRCSTLRTPSVFPNFSTNASNLTVGIYIQLL